MDIIYMYICIYITYTCYAIYITSTGCENCRYMFLYYYALYIT